MGTSCFVTVTTYFCSKSLAPLFELSIFFVFTIKVPLINLLAEEEEPSFIGFMSFTFDEAFPLLYEEAMTHKSHPKSLFSLTTTSREKVDPREKKCWAQIKDAAKPHHDQLPLLPFKGNKRERERTTTGD
ncbi:hypothetical protein AMTRI_Chr12g272190 [Amborella trichopoda]